MPRAYERHLCVARHGLLSSPNESIENTGSMNP